MFDGGRMTDDATIKRMGGGRNRKATGEVWNTPKDIERARLTTAHVIGTINQARVDFDHNAPFADWLADAFVLCYCAPGGTVCDPFVGSGTVALSCARNGRNFIGGDLGARERDGRRWADIARERAIAERDRPRQIGLTFG